MRKLYLISNYVTALYDMDQSGHNCITNSGEVISVEDAIELFSQNKTVRVYGISKAIVQERLPCGRWSVIKSIIPGTDDILINIPLETQLLNLLIMTDYDKWDNGDYNGDCDEKKEIVDSIMRLLTREKYL